MMPVKFHPLICLALTLAFSILNSPVCLAATEKQALVTSAQLTKPLSDSEEKVGDLRKLAASYAALGELTNKDTQAEQAYIAYGQALLLYRKLSEDDPDTFLLPLTQTLTSMADIDMRKERYQKAQSGYEEAIPNYRRLAAKDVELHMPQLAKAIGNSGITYFYEKKPEQALLALNEATAISRPLIIKNLALLSDFSFIHYYLDFLIWERNKPVEIRQYLEASVTFYRALYSKYPSILASLADSLSKLSDVIAQQGDFNEANKMQDEIIILYRQLSKESPDIFNRRLAWVLYKQGTLSATQEKLPQARVALSESISIYRKEIKKDAGLLPLMEGPVYTLGLIDQEEKKFPDALRAFEEARNILRQQKDLDIEKQHELGSVSASLGSLKLLMGQSKEALDYIDEALLIRRQLAKSQPRLYLNELIETLMQLGDIHKLAKNHQKAKVVYQEIIALSKINGPLETKMQSRVNAFKFYLDSADKPST